MFITARVHPGETPASFIAHGLLQFLVSDHPAAAQLRQRLVFKVVPMLNPDGVFLGNYRCSSAGVDLNRQWAAPEQWLAPEVCATRRVLLEYHRSTQLHFFVDIHAHSTATSGFMYCNAVTREDLQMVERESVFPRLLDANSPHFSFHHTRFDNDPSKEGSGRRALGELLPDVHCYTLEVSFYANMEYTGGKALPYTVESCVCCYCVLVVITLTAVAFVLRLTDMQLGKDLALTFVDYYQLVPRSRAIAAVQKRFGNFKITP